MSNLKEVTLIIKEGRGFFYNGVISEGGKIMNPYKKCGTKLRVIREICFRLPLFPKTLWYNKKILEEDWTYIIVFDPLVTKHFLNWLMKQYPHAAVHYTYGNMVGKARHLCPSEIPKGIKVWSYDEGDCKKYDLSLYHYPYFRMFLKPLKESKYDVMFVGADKGRADYLAELEKKMNDVGLKTKFIMTKQGKLDKNKAVYQKRIPYNELVEIVTESRAILNVVMPGQTGVTMRDIESLLFGVKLVTTNPTIEEKDFYHPNNIFKLKGNCLDGLSEFIKKPIEPISESIKKRYTLDGFIEHITKNGE